MTRKTLYMLLGALSFGGYACLAWHGMKAFSHAPPFGTCMFKAITHVPCPSCGSTRAIVLLLRGDIEESLSLNPLGALLLIGLVIVPPWLLADILTNRESLHRLYTGAERVLKRKVWILVPFVILVIVNWVWNIRKGL